MRTAKWNFENSGEWLSVAAQSRMQGWGSDSPYAIADWIGVLQPKCNTDKYEKIIALFIQTAKGEQAPFPGRSAGRRKNDSQLFKPLQKVKIEKIRLRFQANPAYQTSSKGQTQTPPFQNRLGRDEEQNPLLKPTHMANTKE